MSARRIFPPRALAMAMLVSLLSGCVSQTQEGDATVFRWELWVPLLVIGGGIFSVVLALLLWRWAKLCPPFLVGYLKRFSIMFAIMGPLSCVFLVPALFTDKLTVNPQGFAYRLGVWWAPRHFDVQFADLARIELLAKQKKSFGSEETEYDLVCHLKDGKSETVPDHGLMRRASLATILKAAQALGIPVEESTTYAAIAYSPSTGRFGSSSHCATLAEAERVARSQCQGTDARTVIWARHGWCALAVGEDKAFGYAPGKTQAIAERDALTHCRQYTKTPCHIAVSVCADGPE